MRPTPLALLVVQVVVVGSIGWIIWDASDAGALWWQTGSQGAEPAELFHVGSLAVSHLSALIVLGVLEAILLTAGGLYGLTSPPADVRSLENALARREKQMADLEHRIHEVEAECTATQVTLQTEREAHARIPEGLRRYYIDGHDRLDDAAVARVARRELNHWAALAHTFHTGAVAPLLAALEAVPADHRAGLHHYSTHEVVTLLARVSEELRENDWLAKALRWAEARYGT